MARPRRNADDEERPQFVEVKFRGQGERVGLKNFEIWRYKQYWPETVLVLLSPFGDRFFAQHVKSLKLIGDTYQETWFEYTDFAAISSVFPRTKGKLEPFLVGIDDDRGRADRTAAGSPGDARRRVERDQE